MELNELLNRSGISYPTLRKYVGMGLIGRSTMKYSSPGSVSNYPDDSLEKVKLIQHYKHHGNTLEEIKDLISSNNININSRSKALEIFSDYRDSGGNLLVESSAFIKILGMYEERQ